MTTNFLDRLSQDLTKLLECGDGYDTIIYAGEGSDNRLFRVHSAILRFRSSYFYEELQDLALGRKKFMEIYKKNIPADVCEILLRYMYGGVISFDNIDAFIVFQVMIIADEWSLVELANYLEIFLYETSTKWLWSNIALVYHASFSKSENFHTLRQFCTKIITERPDAVFDTTDFESLPENIVTSVINRNDLNVEESKKWDCIIKWGIAQNQTKLPNNPDQWTEVDFYRLKATLNNLLPHIRFTRFSNEEIFNKIRPFQQILEPAVWMNIMQRFEEPINNCISFPSQTQHNLHRNITGPLSHLNSSTIITIEHVVQIATWIDRKFSTYDISNIPYDFKLLLRGSEHGYKSKTFHDICDTVSRTVLVLKVAGTEEILGGYNPLKWNVNAQDKSDKITKKDSWSRTKDSFIFNLTPKNLEDPSAKKINDSYVLSRVQNPGYAFYYSSKWGPNFGNNDLRMINNFKKSKGTSCRQVNYEKPIRKSTEPFMIDEYEIFQICPKT